MQVGSGTASGAKTEWRNFIPIDQREVNHPTLGPIVLLYSKLEGLPGSNCLSFHRIVDGKTFDAKPMAQFSSLPMKPPEWTGKPKPTQEVTSLHVDPAYRGHKLGGILAETASMMMPDVSFLVEPDPFKDRKLSPQELQGVYKRYGFHPSGHGNWMIRLPHMYTEALKKKAFTEAFLDEFNKIAEATKYRVKSTNLKHFTYDPALKELHVTFKTGSTYKYTGVPAKIARALRKNKSAGRTFIKRIRNGGYPFQKVAWSATGKVNMNDLTPKARRIMRNYHKRGGIKDLNNFEDLDLVEGVMDHEDRTGKRVYDEEIWKPKPAPPKPPSLLSRLLGRRSK